MLALQSGSNVFDVVLCNMPWAISSRPSLSLGILKGICNQERIRSKVIYGNLAMSAKIGMKISTEFATSGPIMGLCEHLFACALYGKEALDSDRIIREYSERPDVLAIVPRDYWFYARDEVIPEFLVSAADRILDHSPSIVGFSSTFNQVMSSLALARIVKDRNSRIITIFGGACFHDPMGQEYHRSCSEFVDHVFLGESDDAFRAFIQQWKSGKTPKDIPGITYKNGKEISYLPSEPVTDLNRLPVPDYDDYYLETEYLKGESSFDIVVDSLPYESSRGCWWGNKSQCIFCGLTEEELTFRSRDPEIIVEDIVTLSQKYQELNFHAADMIISWPTLTPVLQQLAALDLDLELFYEVKASVKKEQIELLRNAGVAEIQPGIESLSTDALRLMGKGTTLLINLQCLKWAKEYSIQPHYNLLVGFPNEKAKWYDDVIDLIPMFFHLPPPTYPITPVSLQRFSPLFEYRKNFGPGTVLPRPDYVNCFPPGTIDLNESSYYFYEKQAGGWPFFPERDEENQLQYPNYIQRFKDAVSEWIQLHQSTASPPSLRLRFGDGSAKIYDWRTSLRREYTISGEYLDLILLCDRIQVRSALEQKLGERHLSSRVTEAINDLLESGVLIQEGKKILSLAVADRPRSTKHLEGKVIGSETDSVI